MCMEDIRIARKTDGGVRSFPSTTPITTPVANADPKRVAITFASNGAGIVFVSPSRLQAVTGVGLTLSVANPTLTITIADYGTTICDVWFADLNGVATSLTVFEATVQEQ